MLDNFLSYTGRSKLYLLIISTLLLIGFCSLLINSLDTQVNQVDTFTGNIEGDIFSSGAESYERYAARVDRVEVVLEQRDYTQYRLTTNGLVREGELNTERGFENDVDATVYVLNWQKPEGEQMRYVRLTNEPGLLYLLDSEGKIIRGSVLSLLSEAAI